MQTRSAQALLQLQPTCTALYRTGIPLLQRYDEDDGNKRGFKETADEKMRRQRAELTKTMKLKKIRVFR